MSLQAYASFLPVLHTWKARAMRGLKVNVHCSVDTHTLQQGAKDKVLRLYTYDTLTVKLVMSLQCSSSVHTVACICALCPCWKQCSLKALSSFGAVPLLHVNRSFLTGCSCVITPLLCTTLYICDVQAEESGLLALRRQEEPVRQCAHGDCHL
uniref:Uncharacterized protein n=1 Tax=Rhipicephalus zambeziensis TaxID=60191 RepID=A0A224Y5H5_9ACAR